MYQSSDDLTLALEEMREAGLEYATKAREFRWGLNGQATQ
jgi:hypothetical protein